LNPSSPLVLKFGGAALARPEKVVDRVVRETTRGGPVVLVVSARAGVTDLLADVLRRPREVPFHRRVLRRIETIHPNLPPIGRAQLDRTGRLFRLVERNYPRDAPLGDRLLSQGERLSVWWLSERLRLAGVPAVPVEADHLGLVTDNVYGASCILLRPSQRHVRSGLQRIYLSGRVPVVTGYFGRSQEGRVAVLGRGGSDYSATAIGAILRARRVELIKRDVSILTADPRLVPAARPIPWLTYEEAEELAQFGARVLHPLAIEPARDAGVEIVVRSLDPGGSTTIGAANGHSPIRAITCHTPLRLFRLRVAAGRQRPGVAAEATERLATSGVNLTTLFTSEGMLSIVVDPRAAQTTARALAPMSREGAPGLLGPAPVALVAAFGRGVTGELLARASQVLDSAEGVIASPRSVSMIVPESEGRRVVRRLHRILVECGRRRRRA
jgi:aspartate kinase